MIIYVLIMVLGAQPSILWFWYYWQCVDGLSLVFFAILPFVFFVDIIILIFSSTILSRIFLFFINLIRKPREGVFFRNKHDKDYCYWSLRAVVRKWPIWLARQLHIPIIEKFVYKILGGKASFSSSLHEAWVDCEFVEFGKNVKIGPGSLILSNLIVRDRLIIKKVIIKDNVIIGSQSIVSPGTIIESNTILDTISMTIVNQHLLSNKTYSGAPAKPMPENELSLEKNELEEILFEKKDEDRYEESDLKAEKVKLSVPFHFFIISGILIFGGSYILPGFLFISYIFGLLVPNLLSLQFSFNFLLDFRIIFIIFITPLVFIGVYLLHLFIMALFTRFFYKYADKRGSSEGIFDRDLREASKDLDYYHVRSFLFNYPIYAFLRSPFPWLLVWELKFIGSNKIGKGTVLEECYIHNHINYGKNCYAGTFCHITNHLVDGVVGSENLTTFSVNIGDDSVFNSLTGGLPGTEYGKETTLLSMGTTIKFDKLQGNAIYGGFPIKKLKDEEILKFLGGEYDGK